MIALNEEFALLERLMQPALFTTIAPSQVAVSPVVEYTINIKAVVILIALFMVAIQFGFCLCYHSQLPSVSFSLYFPNTVVTGQIRLGRTNLLCLYVSAGECHYSLVCGFKSSHSWQQCRVYSIQGQCIVQCNNTSALICTAYDSIHCNHQHNVCVVSYGSDYCL